MYAKIECLVNRLDAKIEAALHGLDAKIDATMTHLNGKIGATEASLRQERRHDFGVLSARIHTILYGLIVAILVPVFIRVFFP